MTVARRRGGTWVPRATRVACAVAAAGVALGGCADSGGGSATPSDTQSETRSPSATASETAALEGVEDLEGLTFVSTEVTGHDLVDGSEITVEFHDATMAVSAGCNTQLAAVELADGVLRWLDPPASTMMACSPDAEAQDGWLADLFRAGVTAELDGPTLTLTAADTTVVLTQETGADLTALLGRTWTVVGTIADGATARLPSRTQRPHVVVPESGGLSRLSTGCNTGRTVVRVDGDTLLFGPTTATRVACRQPDREIQRRVLAVLDGRAEAVVLTDWVLVVVNDDLGLVFQVR